MTAKHESEFRSALVGLPTLKSVLEDFSVQHVIVGPNGRWTFEKLGRSRNDQPLLDVTKLSQLSDVVRLRGMNRFGEWSVKTYRGKNGDVILFERLPIPVADRIPQQILGALKRQVRGDGDGAVIGPTGSGKSSLLCWLALQIPDDDVLLISENPPNELPGQHVQHIYPPTSELKRRGFERLIRLSSTVMWDRIASGDDMATLLSSTRAKRRWFTIDATSFHDALNLLTAWSRSGLSPQLKTTFAVSRSGIGRTEPTTLLTFDGDTWIEHHRQDQNYASAMVAFDDGVTRAAERVSAPQQMIRPESEQRTIQVTQSDEMDQPDPTGMISAESLSALRGEAVRSLEMAANVPVSEKTKHYIESPNKEKRISEADGNSTPLPGLDYNRAVRASGSQDAISPDEMIRAGAVDAEPSLSDHIAAIVENKEADVTGEDLNLENLRITRSDIVTDSDLMSMSSGALAALEDDFSSVVDGDSFDLEEISGVYLEEIDERTNPERNALDDETRLQRVSGELTGPRHSIHDDPTFGLTEELTFGEKLEMLRKRRHDS